MVNSRSFTPLKRGGRRHATVKATTVFMVSKFGRRVRVTATVVMIVIVIVAVLERRQRMRRF